MSTQHTPGPWHAQHMGNVNGVRMSWMVKDKLSVGTRNPADEALVSAAPDLLASVIELLEPLERASAAMVAEGKALDQNGEAAFDRARAAIAKATAV